MVWIIHGGKKRKETTEYTVIACGKCSAMQKREFVQGDVVLGSADDACKSCGSKTATIQQIFSEETE